MAMGKAMGKAMDPATPMAWFGAMMAGLLSGLIVTIWLGRKLQKWLGGYTGDCLGATQQLSEVAFYLGVLSIVH